MIATTVDPFAFFTAGSVDPHAGQGRDVWIVAGRRSMSACSAAGRQYRWCGAMCCDRRSVFQCGTQPAIAFGAHDLFVVHVGRLQPSDGAAAVCALFEFGSFAHRPNDSNSSGKTWIVLHNGPTLNGRPRADRLSVYQTETKVRVFASPLIRILGTEPHSGQR